MTEQRRQNELNALYRIAALSASEGDTDFVVNEILRVVSDVVACEQTCLFLYDPLSDELVRRTQADSEQLRVSLSQPSPFRRVYLSATPEIVQDLGADPDSAHTLMEKVQAHSAVLAPLAVGERRLGVLAAMDSPLSAFSQADLSLLTVLADRAALTLENAQLVRTLQRQVQELEGLHRLSRLLTSSESVEHVIGEALAIVTSLLECEKLAVLLFDEDTQELVAQRPVVGLTDIEVDLLRISLDEPSLGGTVYRTSTPLVSNDARSDAWVSARFRDLLDAQSLLVVPLTTGPAPLGIITAVNAKKGYFSEEDLRFLSLLGTRVGSVIEARLARQREELLVRRLQETDRNKSEFVSMLAHELQGPMTTIKGFGEALHSRWDDLPADKRERFLDMMVKEIDRLSRLVGDLLDVSRMEAGTMRFEPEPMSLQELIDSVLTVHSSFRATHAIETHIPEDLPPVLADRDRIRQVLINLVTNGIRYSPEGSTVGISATVLEDPGQPCLQVSVSDEGIGIPEADRERVFSKFAMLPKPNWVKKGTGLGLYISRAIVEAHGGRIWVDPKSGPGTTLNFTLPLAPVSV